jgi:FkbM family methyltransferase
MVARSYDAAARAADDPATIIDLGGNTGLAARWLLNQFPEAKLVSVEPDAGNFRMLEQNLADRAQAVRACAGGTERFVSLTGDGESDAFHMTETGNGDIRVLTMPTIMRDAGVEEVGLLKVDIEGAERELFEECREWIGRVRVLSVECHAGYPPEDAVDALERNGARVEIVERTGDMDRFGYETVVLRCLELTEPEAST